MSSRHSPVHASPVAEGVRIQVGDATAFAVRQESKDVALRLRREYHPARDAMERVPFRGKSTLQEYIETDAESRRVAASLIKN